MQARSVKWKNYLAVHLLLRWIVGKYHLVYFSLCRKHITLESGHDKESLAKRVSNICRDKVINGCSPGWKQGWNGHIRDMFSKQFTAVKKTKNRNILYKCTYDTFYITTHYIYAATWLIGNNLQYTLTISKLLFFQQSFMFNSVPTKIISWLHNFKSIDWKIGPEKKPSLHLLLLTKQRIWKRVPESYTFMPPNHLPAWIPLSPAQKMTVLHTWEHGERGTGGTEVGRNQRTAA